MEVPKTPEYPCMLVKPLTSFSAFLRQLVFNSPLSIVSFQSNILINRTLIIFKRLKWGFRTYKLFLMFIKKGRMLWRNFRKLLHHIRILFHKFQNVIHIFSLAFNVNFIVKHSFEIYFYNKILTLLQVISIYWLILDFSKMPFWLDYVRLNFISFFSNYWLFYLL